VKGRGRLRYRLRGRFVSPDAAKLVYRASMPPLRPKNPSRPGRCRSRPTRVALGKDGEPPFRRCSQQRARTLIWGSTGRLFMQFRFSTGAVVAPGFIGFVFGCLFETNRRFALAPDSYEAGEADDTQPWWKWPPRLVENLRLAGPYTAWASVSEVPSGFHDDPFIRAIMVVDLRTGARRVIGRPQVSSHPYPTTVDDLALKGNGSVAWIAHGPANEAPFIFSEVWASDGRGRRRLDSGPGISRDLTLRASALTWVKDGVVRSGTLH
jgi:hypothetical protein